jgi:hypothetical protein|tara:strand:+ start:1078 stop:1260 length:183 start_codon:yes stop_codon:yes gene_type:complete
MTTEKKKEKGRQWDGISRPPTDLYSKNFQRIFGNNSKDSENDDTINTSQTNDKESKHYEK